MININYIIIEGENFIKMFFLKKILYNIAIMFNINFINIVGET